ncbi:MAG: hypothetical protein H6Q72_990 [Firmicutes bacterium]|nr:hypothetical protein [Bacillota bacterium]
MLANRQGAASIAAIFVMLILMVIGSGFVFLSLTDIAMTNNYRDGVMAQYLAEAGVKRAIGELRKSTLGEWSGEIKDFAAGTYEVKPVENQGVDRIITSTGTVHKATRMVVVTATTESPYEYVAYSGGNMNLSGLTIEGNIGSNKDIAVSGGTITGSIDATGSIYTTGIDAPRKNAGALPMKLPSFTSTTRSKYKNAGKIATILEDNSQGYSFWKDFTGLDSEVYYVETKYPLLLMFENFRGPGTIYCTNDVILAGARVSNNAIIISEKNITVTAGHIEKVLFIARGDVNVSVAEYCGSIVAGGDLSVISATNRDDKLAMLDKLTNPLLPSVWVADKFRIKTWNSYE